MDVEIAKYSYRLKPTENEAVVFLYDAKTTAVAKLIFNDAADPLPEAIEVNNRLVVHFHRRELHDVVDMLRNEGPVYLGWHKPHAFLSTDLEPVAEGEG